MSDLQNENYLYGNIDSKMIQKLTKNIFKNKLFKNDSKNVSKMIQK